MTGSEYKFTHTNIQSSMESNVTDLKCQRRNYPTGNELTRYSRTAGYWSSGNVRCCFFNTFLRNIKLRMKPINYWNHTIFCTGTDCVWFSWMELLRVRHMLQAGKKIVGDWNSGRCPPIQAKEKKPTKFWRLHLPPSSGIKEKEENLF
jgi:hypothetical protein